MTGFVQARWYTPGRIAGVDLLVLHSTEGYVGHVDALAHDFATRPSSSKASSHSGVDDFRLMDFVRFDDTAYAAPGANADGEHLEMCAMAAWTRAEWLEHPGLLERTARWLAHRCAARRIPARFLDAADLRADRRGITTHREVSEAFGLTDHRDPGVHFPMDHVLRRTREHLGLMDKAQDVQQRTAQHVQAPPFPGILRLGSAGDSVATWQRRLKRRWDFDHLAVDGDFGEGTLAATRSFQHRRGETVDGVVGRRTWAAAWPQ